MTLSKSTTNKYHERLEEGVQVEGAHAYYQQYEIEKLAKTYEIIPMNRAVGTGTGVVIVLHCIDIVLHCIAFYCTVLHYIVCYCIVFYCIVLYCIVFYCIIDYLTLALQKYR